MVQFIRAHKRALGKAFELDSKRAYSVSSPRRPSRSLFRFFAVRNLEPHPVKLESPLHSFPLSIEFSWCHFPVIFRQDPNARG